uniref:Uncharacterized protein n=1 Tax=Pithovirus LCDPAC01 TaxID=2506600 RepID=A0A481YNZ2_9VIRU|nr:MAG: hypothetical protein LCDPAC01_00130 [Pithovirus LCDPAC01]
MDRCPVTLSDNKRQCTKMTVKNSKFCKRHSKCRLTKELLKWLKEGRSKGIYKVLRGQERVNVHFVIKEELETIRENGDNLYLATTEQLLGTVNRLVVGDHGVYYELLKIDKSVLHIDVKQKFRVKLSAVPRTRVKYIWWSGEGGEKIYEQTGTVHYADYVVGRYYISPEDVM